MIDRIFEALADVINRHPKRVAAVIGIIFIIALYRDDTHHHGDR